ncbi:MAG TPA: hypothetical protein VFE79_15095, partial [Paraburkholderia sp.]|nr:hypothetical protein [Paraburkholderia sp.]
MLVFALLTSPVFAQSNQSGIPELPPLPSWMQADSPASSVPSTSTKTDLTPASGMQSLTRPGRQALLDDATGSDAAVAASDAIGTSGRGDRERTVRVPLPPTRFETFVAENTGRKLKLYGFDLFAPGRESAYPSVANMPAPADYRIGPGDEILLHTWG